MFSFSSTARTKRTKGSNYTPGIPTGSEQGGGYDSGIPETQTPPAFIPVEFPTIDPAQYTYTDPIKYAQEVGAANNVTIKQNWNTAKGMALDALNTELQGLKGYAAGSAALKREQIALDNPFNQGQRISQLNSVMPEVAGDLAAQRTRANVYASGRLPDSALDRALELGVRSNAADTSTFAGFGAKSAQASKVSDLMSADQRFQIGQYGEQLLTSNIGTKANLMLAPTEYSQAGTDIRVMPEVGAGRLAYQGLNTINEATMISPSAAITAKVGQEQFKTQIEQRTNEFNATGKFNADTFNSSGMYTAGLNAFNYDVGMANSVAAVNQGLLNTAVQLQTVGLNQQGGQAGISSGQAAQTTEGIVSSLGGISGALNTASGIFTPSDSSTSSTADNARAKLTTEPLSTTTGTTTPVNSGIDASIPTAIKFAGGMDVPQGYSKVATNSDGTYSAVPTDTYRNELEQFAAANKIPMDSIDPANWAMADRAVANAVGVSYQPLPSFQPIATTSSGHQVYSLPAASNGTDITRGAANVTNVGTLLSSLGVAGDDLYSTLGELAGTVSNPATLAALDAAYSSNGAGGVADEIRNRLVGGRTDLSIAPGQQAAVMSQRIGELWGGLSAEQKANALASMTGVVTQLKTGRDVNNELVPGTEKAASGGLRVGDAIALTTQGKNGIGLARNWNQLSSLVGIGTGTRNAAQVAAVADAIGALGYGPQGSAVPVSPGYLAKMGARSAPEFGVGAAVFDKPNHVPPHYKILSQAPDGGTIAIPANMQHTSTLGAGGPAPMSYNKSKSIATGTHPAMKLWGKSTTGAVRGAVGGSALVNSLNQMVNTNPDVASAMMAHSLFNNLHGGE